jgi:hypothetical protein
MKISQAQALPMSALLNDSAQSSPATQCPAIGAVNERLRTGNLSFQEVYHSLAHAIPSDKAKAAARQLIYQALDESHGAEIALPADPRDLDAWMTKNTDEVHQAYQGYLQQRKEGQSRKYFTTLSHALHFLKHVAPTKLVDGAWLYGLTAHPFDPLLSHLLITYLEELGNGDQEKNHVAIYRKLLRQNGIEAAEPLGDEFYQQGAIQLALGWNANEFLPEIVGFNLAYEQLPLHLLITAYELNELGIDPYYFVLHQTIDNSDTGHAMRAVQAAFDCAAGFVDQEEYWTRVRNGAALANYGVGTEEIIQKFHLTHEVEEIFTKKARAGRGAHSNYCRFEGRSVNEWLSDPANIPQFLATLENKGWIQKNQSPTESKFWRLLTGERAEMFGVFSGYELQLIHDWISGDSVWGARRYTDVSEAPPGTTGLPKRPLSFRAISRLQEERRVRLDRGSPVTGSLLTEHITSAGAEKPLDFLVGMLAPGRHWTLAGSAATQEYARMAELPSAL